MNRRGFLEFLGLGAAVAAVAPQVVAKIVTAAPATPVTEAAGVVLGESFLVGDVITFGGVYNVNPMTGKSTGRLKQFVVTSESTIYPMPLDSGMYQNCTKAPRGKPRDTGRRIGMALKHTGLPGSDRGSCAFLTRSAEP